MNRAPQISYKQVAKPIITSVRFIARCKLKPKAGDRRVTKKHGLQIRVQEVSVFNDQVIGRLVRAGKPVFEWRGPQDLKKGDRHWITPEESARYFSLKICEAGCVHKAAA